MKVGAWQAPLLPGNSTAAALRLVREQVDRCEAEGVEILCCPEAILGGLADYAPRPTAIAIDAGGGHLETVLAPLASDTVTTIVGFTEIDRGRLYNAAAVYHRGTVAGLYRKQHPAINRSVYAAGDDAPVFTIGGLTFGIIICLDSTFAEPARTMALQGATALFVPTNNGLPPGKAGPGLVDETRRGDIWLAAANRTWVIRADITGSAGDLRSEGSSGMVSPDGVVLQTAQPFCTGILMTDIDGNPGK